MVSNKAKTYNEQRDPNINQSDTYEVLILSHTDKFFNIFTTIQTITLSSFQLKSKLPFILNGHTNISHPSFLFQIIILQFNDFLHDLRDRFSLKWLSTITKFRDSSN